MDPKHLYFLGEVVRYGSLSRAAERLGVAQPTLTRIIQVIENRVGAPVVRRGRYGVTPTEIGGLLAAQGRTIADTLDQSDQLVKRWRAGIGELRVGVGPMLALSVMPAFFANMLSRMPPYGLNITTATAIRLVDRLNNDELDVVLAPQEINLHQERLEQEVIFKDQMAVFAGKMSLFVSRLRPIDPEELASAPWISVGVHSGIQGSAADIFRELALESVVTKLSFTGDIAMALELLRTTDVLVALPEKLALRCHGITKEQRLRLSLSLPQRNVALWVPRHKRDRPEIVDFRQRIVQSLGTLR